MSCVVPGEVILADAVGDLPLHIIRAVVGQTDIHLPKIARSDAAATTTATAADARAAAAGGAAAAVTIAPTSVVAVVAIVGKHVAVISQTQHKAIVVVAADAGVAAAVADSIVNNREQLDLVDAVRTRGHIVGRSR